MIIRALLTLTVLLPFGVGCNDACKRFGVTLCERLEDESRCEEWREVASTVSNETCQKSLEALGNLPE